MDYAKIWLAIVLIVFALAAIGLSMDDPK